MAAMMATALISACGGGGSSGGAVTPTQASMTQTDVKNVASIGVSSNLVANVRLAPGLVALAGNLESLAIDAGGAGTQAKPSSNCAAGGSETFTVTKLAAHAGLMPGDQVEMAFSNCAPLSSSFVLNGTAKMTIQNAITKLSATDFSVAFEGDLTNFSTTLSGVVTTYTGVVDVQVTGAAGTDSTTVKVSVPKSPGVGVTVALSSGELYLSLGTGATFETTSFATANRATMALNGSVGAIYQGPILAFAVATPTPISGPLASNGLDVSPTAGVVNTTMGSPKLPTSVTIGLSSINVSGDTDGDGAMETAFTTTWADFFK